MIDALLNAVKVEEIEPSKFLFVSMFNEKLMVMEKALPLEDLTGGYTIFIPGKEGSGYPLEVSKGNFTIIGCNLHFFPYTALQGIRTI